MKDRYVFECSIDARKAGAQGEYHMRAHCQIYADNEEKARTLAFEDVCVKQNLETTPPMQVRCLGVDDSGVR